MDTTLLERISFNPNQCGGKPCIRNMRIRVSDILDLIANGVTGSQIIENEFPSLELDDVNAALLYAAAKL